MGKIAFVVVRLVPESKEKTNEEIEREIKEEVSNAMIPWVKEIVKVSVLECSDHDT